MNGRANACMYSATEGGWHRHQPDWYPYTYRSSGLWSNCDKWTWDSYRAGETGTDKCAQVWIRKNGKSFSPCLSRMWNRCSPVDIPMYSHERHRQLHLVQVSVCGIFSSPQPLLLSILNCYYPAFMLFSVCLTTLRFLTLFFWSFSALLVLSTT